MVTANRMHLGKWEFAIDFGSFRRITECWSGPGWDFNFSGACTSDDSFGVDGRIGLYCEAAPLPLAKASDYTGVELDLPGDYDEATGEPFFAVYVGESYNVSDVRLRFAERDGDRYRIEISGSVPASVFGQPEQFEISAWAEELPDHSYGGGSGKGDIQGSGKGDERKRGHPASGKGDIQERKRGHPELAGNSGCPLFFARPAGAPPRRV